MEAEVNQFEQEAEEHQLADTSAEEHTPPESDGPDLIDLTCLPVHRNQGTFKAIVQQLPPARLSRRQCVLPPELMQALRSVSLIDARFKDIDSYQVRGRARTG